MKPKFCQAYTNSFFLIFYLLLRILLNYKIFKEIEADTSHILYFYIFDIEHDFGYNYCDSMQSSKNSI